MIIKDKKPGSVYDEDYFLHGKQTGKSLYENYRWLPDLTIPMCSHIANHCGFTKMCRVLDFGCARGYCVRALRELGYAAFGVDISEWALDNCDIKVRQFLKPMNFFNPDKVRFDWVIAKDVLEHVHFVESTISDIMRAATVGVFAVVPLTRFDNGTYVVEDYDKDITHCQRWTLGTWVRMFLQPGWKIEAAYRVPGVKDNYKDWKCGNGFITARRIKE